MIRLEVINELSINQIKEQRILDLLDNKAGPALFMKFRIYTADNILYHSLNGTIDKEGNILIPLQALIYIDRSKKTLFDIQLLFEAPGFRFDTYTLIVGFNDYLDCYQVELPQNIQLTKEK